MARAASASRPRRAARRSATAAALAGAAFSLLACQQPKAPEPTAAASAEAVFVVQSASVQGMTPAYGQIDSADAVSARARISGTLSDLRVREGASVQRGAVLAVISDARVPLQAQAEGAQAAAIQAQLAQARADLQRFERLHADGFYPTQRLDQQRVLVTSLEDQLQAARSQRAVTVETGAQGNVLAPVAGTVLRVPVRRGGVVMMGEEIALVGSTYIIKLRLPERHAATLQEGGEVAVETPGGGRQVGRVRRIYPALEDGRVEADIETEGLQDRVFGERVRVWTPADQRQAIVVPAAFLTSRYGVDFARVRGADGVVHDVVVRRGEPVTAEGVTNAVEVLSGLSAGDQLVQPETTARAHTP
jgi:RND family efflux transporter MFP subunit